MFSAIFGRIFHIREKYNKIVFLGNEKFNQVFTVTRNSLEEFDSLHYFDFKPVTINKFRYYPYLTTVILMIVNELATAATTAVPTLIVHTTFPTAFRRRGTLLISSSIGFIFSAAFFTFTSYINDSCYTIT